MLMLTYVAALRDHIAMVELFRISSGRSTCPHWKCGGDMDDVNLMCMQCGVNMGDVFLMFMLCGGYVDDVDSQ